MCTAHGGAAQPGEGAGLVMRCSGVPGSEAVECLLVSHHKTELCSETHLNQSQQSALRVERMASHVRFTVTSSTVSTAVAPHRALSLTDLGHSCRSTQGAAPPLSSLADGERGGNMTLQR